MKHSHVPAIRQMTDLDRGRERQRRCENGVLCPCMDIRHAILTSLYFHVVFDVRVLDLNLSTDEL
jgi:hypothetical protein